MTWRDPLGFRNSLTCHEQEEILGRWPNGADVRRLAILV
jgi:hypothetical protein